MWREDGSMSRGSMLIPRNAVRGNPTHIRFDEISPANSGHITAARRNHMVLKTHAALTQREELIIVRAHERPFANLRHLPGDYSLATLAGCGRLFSSSRPVDAGQVRRDCPWT